MKREQESQLLDSHSKQSQDEGSTAYQFQESFTVSVYSAGGF